MNKLFQHFKNKISKKTIVTIIFIIFLIAIYKYSNSTIQAYMDIFIFFFLFVLVIMFPSLIKSKKENSLVSVFKNTKGFQSSKYILSYDLESAIALDETNKKVCLVQGSGHHQISKIIEFKDILSSEIIENDESVIKTQRSSQIGGAIIGGIVLGGVGAIIGGLSGKKHQINKIKNIDLQILINDSKHPIYKINFLSVRKTSSFAMNNDKDDSDGYSKDSGKYKYCISNATKWHSILKVIINNADKENNLNIQNNNNLSVSDEIRKLKALKDDGLITDDEFISQKNKVLNS